MLDKRSKTKLDDAIEKRKCNIARMVYITQRTIHEWAVKRWNDDGYTFITPDYMRIISIIGADSVNNNELARRARVSKQAMSKMVNNLVKLGMIETVADPTDSRSNVIVLSKKGVDFFSYTQSCVKEINAMFIDIIGEKKMEKLIDIMGELVEGILAKENAELAKK